ncbi:imidazolonepropionase [Croceicoccus gelatinilyticus]|uniref:imidazolonepropionase n=1 Tax=Croceicoccus gelatinilyticus TaxID=2835536 RepID=UPI001BCC5D67|nr:imidazolonepropionase [Croceicoccus gelatinilyticus]MBS7670948.1 imidazolonepropionase [Croceicoccus gelatinilyticus]
MQCETRWTAARLATMTDGCLTVIPDAMIAAQDGRVVYAGPASAAPDIVAERTVDCEGRLVTPGLIDCHTHLVFAGNRAAEHEMRRTGASYEEISRAGGGIRSTVTATRAASEDELVSSALPRLNALIAEGATTVEVKSGYGLDLETEMRMLRAARRLADERRVTIRTTFLGAHALPAEFAGRADDYIDLVTQEMIPAVASEGLADAVDVFCENIGFTPAQTEKVFEAAAAHDLPVKLHAEQLSDQKGASLAAAHGALSADHLEHLDDTGVAAMAKAGTVATLLPGAFYFMRETRKPPVALLRKADVPIALATDCNPGTSPLTSLLLAMNMGSVLFGLTVEECLAGVTCNAARALGMSDGTGTLTAGKQCDMAIWNVGDPAELVHAMGANPLHARIWRGR